MSASWSLIIYPVLTLHIAITFLHFRLSVSCFYKTEQVLQNLYINLNKRQSVKWYDILYIFHLSICQRCLLSIKVVGHTSDRHCVGGYCLVYFMHGISTNTWGSLEYFTLCKFVYKLALNTGN